jgi:hypothetical protein
MAESSLLIRFQLEDSGDVSPSDFEGFFSVGAEVLRNYLFDEAVELIAALELPAELEAQSLGALIDSLRVGPVPAIVVDVRHSSPWYYDIHLDRLLVATVIIRCLAPEVKAAWKGSRAQQLLQDFLRNRLFMGPAIRVKKAVSRTKPRQQLRPKAVSELKDSHAMEQRLLVQVERVEPIIVNPSDQELLDEVAKRLKK